MRLLIKEEWDTFNTINYSKNNLLTAKKFPQHAEKTCLKKYTII